MSLLLDRAWSRLHGDDAAPCRDAIAALAPEQWFGSSLAIEAVAARAEIDADFAPWIARFHRAMDTIDPSLQAVAQLWLGRLYAGSMSHSEASAALARAEAGALSAREGALLALSRGMLANARRAWSDAVRELRTSRAAFERDGDALGALLSATQLGHTLTAMGHLVEAHDELWSVRAQVPSEGVAAARWTVTMAALQSHRGEHEEARAQIAEVERALSRTHTAALAVWGLAITTRAELDAWREDYDGASAALQSLAQRARDAGSPVYEGFARYSQAMFEFDAGRIERSLEIGADIAAIGRAIDVATLIDGAALVRAAALAALGRRGEALVEYRSVRPPFNVDSQPSYGVGQLAKIELLLVPGAASEADRASWIERAHKRAALLCARVEQGALFCESTLTNRLLWRRLQRVALSSGAPLPATDAARARCVSPDGAAFVLCSGERVSLRHRPVLVRVLATLAASEGPISIEPLARAAWPEDRSSSASMKARVRVAVATLRQLGLGDAIETVSNGYRLRCEVGPDAIAG